MHKKKKKGEEEEERVYGCKGVLLSVVVFNLEWWLSVASYGHCGR